MLSDHAQDISGYDDPPTSSQDNHSRQARVDSVHSQHLNLRSTHSSAQVLMQEATDTNIFTQGHNALLQEQSGNSNQLSIEQADFDDQDQDSSSGSSINSLKN